VRLGSRRPQSILTQAPLSPQKYVCLLGPVIGFYITRTSEKASLGECFDSFFMEHKNSHVGGNQCRRWPINAKSVCRYRGTGIPIKIFE